MPIVVVEINVMDTNALVTGAVGGIATLIIKYVIDRFSEVHKSAIGVAAKRREKFNEKQAMVLAGVYHRLQRCVEDMSEIYFHGDEGELEPIISQAVENQLSAKLEKARKSYEKLETFHGKYGLYLPEFLDDSVNQAILVAQSHLDEFDFAFAKGFDELNADIVNTIIRLRGDNIILVIELKKAFRRLLVDEPPAGVVGKLLSWWHGFRRNARTPAPTVPTGIPRASQKTTATG
jgi:hypothetical protein